MTRMRREIVGYDDMLDVLAAGRGGTTLEQWLKDLSDGDGDGDYTVYWPKDSIRVISGASYEVARAVYCALRDPRTRWMGRPTSDLPAFISFIRRDLAPGFGFASEEQVASARVFAKDRLLPWDISCHVEDRPTEIFSTTRRFDFSTLPEA